MAYFEVIKNENSPLICNIPHSGIKIPQEYTTDYVISEEDLRREAKYMADLYTDDLYAELLFVSSFIKATISRIVVDIERFKNEADEPMSKVGMPALYTRTSDGNLLRKISSTNKEILEKTYNEYHDGFTELVRSSLKKHDIAMIIDCHSFPSSPRIYEPDQTDPRPDICIGTDTYHTPQPLVDLLKHNFEELGYSVKINSPFAGTIVPDMYYKKEPKVISVMVEVNRSLYMNEETFQKLTTFSSTGRSISRAIIKSLNQFIA